MKGLDRRHRNRTRHPCVSCGFRIRRINNRFLNESKSDQGVKKLDRCADIGLIVEHDSGRLTAVAQTVDRPERKAAVSRRLAHFHSKASLRVFDKFLAAPAAAEFGAADTQDIRPGILVVVTLHEPIAPRSWSRVFRSREAP